MSKLSIVAFVVILVLLVIGSFVEDKGLYLAVALPIAAVCYGLLLADSDKELDKVLSAYPQRGKEDFIDWDDRRGS